jgi:bifunctional DNA primase/polymerase-like protein
MAFFKDIAAPLAQLGIPVFPLQEHTKKPEHAFTKWPDLATTDLVQIEEWDRKYPNANVASVAKAQIGGVWFFEVDRPEVAQRIETETGQRVFAIDTFMVRSRPGRGHFYFKQNVRSIEMDNIAQGYVKNTDWSARVNNQYVVGPGSWHPDSGQQYHVIKNASIIEAPDWLIEWCISQKLTEKAEKLIAKVEPTQGFDYSESGQREFRVVDVTPDGPKIPYGGHDSTLTSIAGKLHHDNPEWSENEIASQLIILCEARCENYGADYREMCEKIAHSIGKRPIKVDAFKENIDRQAEQLKQQIISETSDEPEIETASSIPRPEFPSWVMHGTSLWEGLVKPVEETSDKYAELVFMPAVVMYLNYLGNKVTVKNRPFIPSLFLGIVSPYGKFYKSTSCEIAQEYFRVMGIAVNHNQKMTSTNSQTVIISPGSTEGLGLEMYRMQGKNAVIFFDELGKFIRKAGVEHSSFTEDMLSFYEARRFSNSIKARKESFTFDSGSYCFSWMWATTDRKFPGLWAQLPGDSTGLNDRMFFLITPEKEKKARFHERLDAFTLEGIEKTRALISAAIAKKEYQYDPYAAVDKYFDGLDAREQTLTERLALYFAIDMGEEMITAEAIERAKALTIYARQSLAFLAPIEANSNEGRLAKLIVSELQRVGGKTSYRDMYRKLDGLGEGRLWKVAFEMLINQRIIAYRDGIRGGPNHKPAMVYLLKEEE